MPALKRVAAIMDAVLRAVAPSAFATIQDGGRRGWQRFGVARGGAMDQAAFALANVLAGNLADAAAIEFAYAGGGWALAGTRPCRLAVTGAGFPVWVDGTAVPPCQTLTLYPGQHLRIGGAGRAVWGYLAVEGGIDVPAQLGSRSTHVRFGLGGLDGRGLRAGDTLRIGPAPPGARRVRLAAACTAAAAEAKALAIRVVMGPQDDLFSEAGLQAFLTGEYRVTNQIDRMAYRLAGAPVAHAQGFNIVSDGTQPGSIQVPGTGQPIVLMRDCQPTGGYPKIATVITPDLARLAQARPGSTVRFQAVDLATAQALRSAYLRALRTLPERLAELPSRFARPARHWLHGS